MRLADILSGHIPLMGLLFVGVSALCYTLTGLTIPLLRRFAMIDYPTARGSHRSPTLRGGGIAVNATVLSGWALISIALGAHRAPFLLAGAAILVVISGLDDIRGLPPLTRIIAQTAAVALGMCALGWESSVLGLPIPLWIDHLVVFMGWLWFVNLYNFMDGINGMTSVETISIGIGIATVITITGGPAIVAIQASLVAGAAAGFLPWNWNKAKVFLGDVGSLPLGYFAGFLLIGLAQSGHRVAALVIPLYYLADATITLARRFIRGARVWESHREHFYQVATPAGASHSVTVKKVIGANVVLILLAIASLGGQPLPALVLAFGIVGALLMSFAQGRQTTRARHVSWIPRVHMTTRARIRG